MIPRRETMCGLRLRLAVLAAGVILVSFISGAGAVECYWCSGVGKDRQCELSPRTVSTGPVTTKCSMRYCISTKVMDGVTGEVQSFARHCDHIPHGNVCVRDSRLITCFETCTSDLCNSGNPDPSYLRTQAYSLTYLGLPGLSSALYTAADERDVQVLRGNKTRGKQEYKEFGSKSSKTISNVDRLKIEAYKNKEGGNEGDGQRGTKTMRPWKWWEMTRGNRRKQGHADAVGGDTNQTALDRRGMGQGVTRPAPGSETGLAVNTGRPVTSAEKTTDVKPTTARSDAGVTGATSKNKGDKQNFSQRRVKADSKHAFDYVGYSPSSKKKQKKLSNAFEKGSTTVPVKILPPTQLRQQVRPNKKIDSKQTIKKVGFEQGQIKSSQGHSPPLEDNIQWSKDNMQSSPSSDFVSRSVDRNLNEEFLNVNKGSHPILTNDGFFRGDIKSLQSEGGPEYADVTEDELELIPLIEALLSDAELASKFQTLMADVGTGKEPDSMSPHTFPAVTPTYGLLETANIYSSRRDWQEESAAPSAHQNQNDGDFMRRKKLGHRGAVTKFRNFDQRPENDAVPHPFRIRSLDKPDELQMIRPHHNLDRTIFGTTTASLYASSTFSTRGASIAPTKQDNSLQSSFLKLDPGKSPIHKTNNETLSSYKMNEGTSDVTSPGTVPARPKKTAPEIDLSPSDSGYILSAIHNNFKTRPPHWVNDVSGRTVRIHTGKTKETKMPIEINSLKFAKPGLRTTVFNLSPLQTTQVPLSQEEFSNSEKVNVNTRSRSITVATTEANIIPHSSPPITRHPLSHTGNIKQGSGGQSTKQSFQGVNKSKEFYLVNNALRLPSGRDKTDEKSNHQIDAKSVNNKRSNDDFPRNRLGSFERRSGAAVTYSSSTPQQRTFDTRLTKPYLNNNEFLTAINLKLGKQKFDSLPTEQTTQSFVTPRSNTYKTTLTLSQAETLENATTTEVIREEKSGHILNNSKEFKARSLGVRLSKSVGGPPAEEVPIAAPYPSNSVAGSENSKTELQTSLNMVDKISQSFKTEPTAANSNNLPGTALKDKRNPTSEAAHFRTTVVDMDDDFQASFYTRLPTRPPLEPIPFNAPSSINTRDVRVTTTAQTIKAKRKNLHEISLKVTSFPRLTPQDETLGPTSDLTSNTLKTSSSSLERKPNDVFHSGKSPSEETRRDISSSATQSSQERTSTTSGRPYSLTKGRRTPNRNGGDKFVLEAYKDTVKGLSHKAYTNPLTSPIRGTTRHDKTPTVFVTPSVYRLGRLEKLEGGNRMFTFNFSSSLHSQNTVLCFFALALTVLMPRI